MGTPVSAEINLFMTSAQDIVMEKYIVAQSWSTARFRAICSAKVDLQEQGRPPMMTRSPGSHPFVNLSRDLIPVNKP